jgi:O-methyltransferase
MEQFNFVSCNSCTVPAVIKALELNNLSGCYAEFGVFRGGSFCNVLKYLNSNNTKINKCYGFDSFTGFPPPSNDMERMYSKGTMGDTDYEQVCNFVRGTQSKIPYELIKGYFDAVFPSKELEPIAVCLVDCDAYTPSLLVLNYIKKYMQNGAIIVFDDYNLFDACQKTAIKDFLDINKDIELFKLQDVSTPEWTVPIYEWKVKNEK